MIFEIKGFESLVFTYAIYLFLLLPHLRDAYNFVFRKKTSRVKPLYGWKLTIPSLAIGFSLIVFETLAHFDVVTPDSAFKNVFVITFLAIAVSFVYYVITDKPKNGGIST